MTFSRRALLRQIAAGAGVGAATASLARATPLDLPRQQAGPVRLHRNENAAGPSTTVLAAIRDAVAHGANHYPDLEEDALRDALAGVHGVTRAHIVLGCGSSELLRMAVAAYAGPGRTVVVAVPSFEPMEDAAAAAGAEAVAVPLTSTHAHDLDAMLGKVDGATGLVYVCNPNNPTGTLTRRSDIERFIGALPATACVLVDEAYHHYAGASPEYVSFIDRPIGDGRVIVTRTFSTIHGLAGLRVGYAVASPDVASRLALARLSDGVSTVAAVAAIAALADVEYVRATARQNVDTRQEFFNQANARMLRTLDSHANFVMLDTGRPGLQMVEHFKQNGILVSGPSYGFPKHIRVSLGLPDEMRAFWRVLDLLPPMRTMSM